MFFGGFFKCENDPRSERKEGGKEAAVVSLEKVPTFDALFLGDHSQLMSAMGKGWIIGGPVVVVLRVDYF